MEETLEKTEKFLVCYVDGTATYDIAPKNGNNARIGSMWKIFESDGTELSELTLLEDGFFPIPWRGTSNQSEFVAILCAVIRCMRYDADHVIIYSDSNLAVQAINGRYKCKKVLGGAKWVKKVNYKAEKNFKSFELTHISRDYNLAHGIKAWKKYPQD